VVLSKDLAMDVVWEALQCQRALLKVGQEHRYMLSVHLDQAFTVANPARG
jgi:hypothetical protein